MAITKGKIDLPPRILIHGEGGVGKTMWAAGAPNPIFVTTERGTEQLDLARHDLADNFGTLLANIRSSANKVYDTIVVDSLTETEPLVWQEACRLDNKKTLNQVNGGYQHEWEAVADVWASILRELDYWNQEHGKAIILIAHTTSQKIKEADKEAYYRWQPDMHHYASQQIFRWADCAFYAHFEVVLKGVDQNIHTKEATRKTAIGGDRKLRVLPTPSVLAKSRYEMPAEVLELSWAAVAPAFGLEG